MAKRTRSSSVSAGGTRRTRSGVTEDTAKLPIASVTTAESARIEPCGGVHNTRKQKGDQLLLLALRQAPPLDTTSTYYRRDLVDLLLNGKTDSVIVGRDPGSRGLHSGKSGRRDSNP